MIKGIYHSARSLQSCNKNMETIANNLANLNSAGFKREGLFSEILSSYGEPKIRSSVDMTQGEVYETKNPFDLAIVGKGMFVLKTEDGNEFTRKGNFHISDEGFLVNEDGKKVLGKNGEINLNDFLTEENKVVSVTRQGEVKVGEMNVDTLLLAEINPDDYEKRKMGLNFDPLEDIQNIPNENDFQILQGYLEESNVNPIVEMENMIKISKDYESAYKMVTYLDESLGKANEMGKF